MSYLWSRNLMGQYWGGQLLGGYAGLEHTADKIARFIPKCITYVEPFAGLGRVAQLVDAEKYILNDMSDFAYNYLKNNFTADVFHRDFEWIMEEYEGEDTFFLIDPPWRTEHYGKNKLTYMDRTPKEYYQVIFKYLRKSKSKWIVCGVADERQTGGLMSNNNYNKLIVESDKNVIFGKKARTLLVSNQSLGDVDMPQKCPLCGYATHSNTEFESHLTRSFHMDSIK